MAITKYDNLVLAQHYGASSFKLRPTSGSQAATRRAATSAGSRCTSLRRSISPTTRRVRVLARVVTEMHH